MSWQEETLEFQKGIGYAFAPHNLHPASPIMAIYDVYQDPTDPYSWGYLTGSAVSVAPFRVNPSGKRTEWTSMATFAYVLATKGGGSAALVVPMLASQVIDLQVKAGQHIGSGGTKDKDMYVGLRSYEENAKTLGFNLIYQPGGIQI